MQTRHHRASGSQRRHHWPHRLRPYHHCLHRANQRRAVRLQRSLIRYPHPSSRRTLHPRLPQPNVHAVRECLILLRAVHVVNLSHCRFRVVFCVSSPLHTCSVYQSHQSALKLHRHRQFRPRRQSRLRVRAQQTSAYLAYLPFDL